MKDPLERRALGEAAAVIATGLLHLFFEEVLHAKGPFILLAGIGWGTYLVLSIRKNPRLPREWGFGREGLGPTARWAGGILLVGAALLALAGALRGTLSWNPHLLPILLLYPIWGLLQQFLLQALLARNLDRLMPSRRWTVPATALLFAGVHLPDFLLAGATLLLALLFVPIYLRYRNLYPLGVVHGLLGALAYFWVLGRDPWMEILASLG